MLNRIAQKALLRLAEQFPIVGITGPRQSGINNRRLAILDDL